MKDSNAPILNGESKINLLHLKSHPRPILGISFYQFQRAYIIDSSFHTIPNHILTFILNFGINVTHRLGWIYYVVVILTMFRFLFIEFKFLFKSQSTMTMNKT